MHLIISVGVRHAFGSSREKKVFSVSIWQIAEVIKEIINHAFKRYLVVP
jgi:hypothetical protein